MRNMMKIVKSLEDSSLLIKDVTQTIEIETKEQRGGFLSMLLGTLSAGLFRQKHDQSRCWSRQSWTRFLIPTHPLTNLKYKSITRTNPKLKVIIWEII